MSATQSAERATAAQTQTPSSRSNGAGHRKVGRPHRQAAPARTAPTDVPQAELEKLAAKFVPTKGRTPQATPAQPQVIQSLVQMLPQAGAKWTQAEAVTWMEAIAANLRLVYQFAGPITVTGTPA